MQLKHEIITSNARKFCQHVQYLSNDKIQPKMVLSWVNSWKVEERDFRLNCGNQSTTCYRVNEFLQSQLDFVSSSKIAEMVCSTSDLTTEFDDNSSSQSHEAIAGEWHDVCLFISAKSRLR